MNWSKSQDANSFVELNYWGSLIMRIPKLNSYYKSGNYKNHISICFVPIKETKQRIPIAKVLKML